MEKPKWFFGQHNNDIFENLFLFNWILWIEFWIKLNWIWNKLNIMDFDRYNSHKHSSGSSIKVKECKQDLQIKKKKKTNTVYMTKKKGYHKSYLKISILKPSLTKFWMWFFLFCHFESYTYINILHELLFHHVNEIM